MQNKIREFNKLKSEWKKFRSKNKNIRIRDAASKMGVSEAEILSTEIGDSVSYLSISDFSIFLKDILCADKLMILIRNKIVVHENIIESKNVKLVENQIVDMDGLIILDFNSSHFKYAFFQNKLHARRQLRSFQIFNNKGDAVVKIYLKSKDMDIFDNIALKYGSKYNYELQSGVHPNHLIEEYQYIDFYFDKNNNIPEIVEISNQSLRILLNSASNMKLPIQIHGLGLGSVQYHRDIVKNIVDYGPWLNVIDKKFNLHVLESEISKSTLNMFTINNQKYFVIDFFDSENNHVLGITSVKGFENNFLSIVNKIKG